MRSLSMISVIYRKTSYMTAVNDHCKQASFFVVNDWGTAVYGRVRSTWDHLPTTIRLYIPHNPDACEIYLCVGIEEKATGNTIYSSPKKTFNIKHINERCKEFLVTGLFEEFYNYL